MSKFNPTRFSDLVPTSVGFQPQIVGTTECDTESGVGIPLNVALNLGLDWNPTEVGRH